MTFHSPFAIQARKAIEIEFAPRRQRHRAALAPTNAKAKERLAMAAGTGISEIKGRLPMAAIAHRERGTARGRHSGKMGSNIPGGTTTQTAVVRPSP